MTICLIPHFYKHHCEDTAPENVSPEVLVNTVTSTPAGDPGSSPG